MKYLKKRGGEERTKMMHCGEKEFTLTESPGVAATLGIITAVIIPNIGTFMTMGTVSAANSETENVKTASPDYYADVQEWPDDTASKSGNYTFADYYAGKLKAKYYFDDDGFISGVSDTTADTPDSGGVCSEYNRHPLGEPRCWYRSRRVGESGGIRKPVG